MGHVPPGTFPPKGARPQLPRRQHRRAGAGHPDLTRRRLGSAGEHLAERFLDRRELAIEQRNVRVGRGEIDRIVRDGRQRVVVEVKTVTGSDPARGFTLDKAEQVHRLARAVGAARVDLVTVELGRRGVTFRWYRGV